MSETDISRSIRSALTRAGYWVERVNSGKARVRGGFVQLAKAGTPDTVIIAPIYGWLETKTEEGKLNPAQKLWHAKARRHRVKTAVVRSVGDAMACVKAWRAE